MHSFTQFHTVLRCFNMFYASDIFGQGKKSLLRVFLSSSKASGQSEKKGAELKEVKTGTYALSFTAALAALHPKSFLRLWQQITQRVLDGNCRLRVQVPFLPLQHCYLQAHLALPFATTTGSAVVLHLASCFHGKPLVHQYGLAQHRRHNFRHSQAFQVYILLRMGMLLRLRLPSRRGIGKASLSPIV